MHIPKCFLDKRFHVRHSIDVILTDVFFLAHDVHDLLVNLGLDVLVHGQGVQVEQDRRCGCAQPVGEQRQADHGDVSQTGTIQRETNIYILAFKI